MKSQFGLWAVCLLLAGVFALPQAAHAQCTLASFNGSHAYTLSGKSAGKSVKIAGILAPDGAGNFTDTQTITFPPGDVDVVLQDQGTYQVNADCTITLVFHFGDDIVWFDGVLVTHGPVKGWLVSTSPDTVISGAFM